VIDRLSRVEGAVGWCVCVSGVCGLMAGSLPDDVAREIFGPGEIVAGSVNPTGKAVPVQGGYRVGGRWSWGSGIDNCTWVVCNGVVHDGDRPRRKASGASDMRFILLPRQDVEVLDTWRVGGLRGTGSHDYVVNGVFAPETHATPAFAEVADSPSALYRTPMISLFAVALAAVTLGIARAAIDDVIALASAKTPMGSRVGLREKPMAQTQVARAEALWRASRAVLLEAIEAQWEEISSGDSPSLEKRAGVRLACTFAAESCAEAVDLVYDTAGGSAIQESGRIERCFRDIHAAKQHIGLATNNYELAGRALLGLDVGTPRF
jgi:alkylation response protein AidB-like acyl-CoA dehydrogenase